MNSSPPPALPAWLTLRRTILAATAVGALILILLVFFLLLRRKKRLPGEENACPSGTAAPTPPPSTSQVVAGTYRIVRRIGEGGMGVVYEALDVKLNRRVALKRANDDHNNDPEERKQFLNEAQIGASLKHPNIMTVYAATEEAGLFYYVCELLEGKNVAEIISSKGHLTIQECLAILKGLCSAVDYAHSKGVIHRDLKPANIMIDNGTVKIMDFGISRITKNPDGRTQTLVVAGTPAFMPPEQSFGTVSREIDLYAMGVTLYDMLAGRLPFEGPTAWQDKIDGKFPPEPLAGHNKSGIDEFFKRALQPDSTKRFHSGAELLGAFQRSVS